MGKNTSQKVKIEDLRWTVDPGTLPFENTKELEPLDSIIGQERGVAALKFGIGIDKAGYNVMVTGEPRLGRMSVVQELLESSSHEGPTPEDLCYVHNFKNPDSPILLRLAPGKGREFKKDIHDFVETMKAEVPRTFESEEYINRKKEIMETYEKETRNFFVKLEEKVKEAGFALVKMQIGQMQRPELMPIVDGEPVPMIQLEERVEKGRFPKEEFEELKKKYESLKKEIDEVFLEIRSMQKEVQEKEKKTDKLMFDSLAREQIEPLLDKYDNERIKTFLHDIVDDMSENLQHFYSRGQDSMAGMMMMQGGDPFSSYQVNLLVDNGEQKGPPVIIESYPTYRNLFGSIERVVDNRGVWRTDFSRINAGAFVKANGGYLVFNLMDAIMEPGVWPALKRALKSKKMEIQTFDPFYFFSSTGLKPEPIELDVKVIVIAEPQLYYLLQFHDSDVSKIFKVRADFGPSMDKSEDKLTALARFICRISAEEETKPFSRDGVAVLLEEAVRLAGRQEKLSTSFPRLADLIREADFWASTEEKKEVSAEDVHKAVEEREYRSSRLEEYIQEMIERGTLLIDVEGSKVGQVNGLAVLRMGDYMFGRPSRITASTSMGKEGIINIEREADMSGPVHNKGVLVLSGYLRKMYAQEKPLSMSASIAFEQSYSGVDGDSASSTEIYALLSSLSETPLRQDIAVTGSLNQKGEVQAIGGVNEKIEGFYHCCKKIGLTGDQGVIIPYANIKDLMLRKDVIDAIKENKFHVYGVKTIEEGIEILSGKKAGTLTKQGKYTKGSIHYLVDAKLKELAEGLKGFGGEEKKEQNKKSKS